ncbi:MAG: hypothetical protein HYY23_03050 [Verrucomicrobia bacterium]|nr:hypothetical protein [Verrucomicrobiota bacterium]
MKTRKLIMLLSTAVLGVLFTIAHHTVVGQTTAPAIQNVIGAWRGFYQALGGPDTIGDPDIVPGNFVIGSQFNRRFDAALSVGIDACIFPGEGTIAASDHAIFSGKSSEGMAIADVALQDFGGGAAIFDGSVKIHPSDGTRSEGSLIVLRNFIGNPDEIPSDVTGDWRGFAVSAETGVRREVTAHFEAERNAIGLSTTSFGGEVGIFPCIFPSGLGTINAQGDLVLIAQGDGERLSVTGKLDAALGPEPHIKGAYLMKHNDGFEEGGTFEIVRVIIHE